MCDDVLIASRDVQRLRWPRGGVRCGASIGEAGPAAAASIPACRRHARSEAAARWLLAPSRGSVLLRLPVFLGVG